MYHIKIVLKIIVCSRKPTKDFEMILNLIPSEDFYFGNCHFYMPLDGVQHSFHYQQK